MNLAQPIDRSAGRRPDAVPLFIACEEACLFGSAEYRALFDRAAATAFQHPTWLENFYRTLAPHRNAHPVIVTGRDAGTGALRLILPMILRTIAGMRLLEAADLGVSDYAAPVRDPALNLNGGFADRIREALPPADYLRIRPVRGEHLSGWRALIEERANGRIFPPTPSRSTAVAGRGGMTGAGSTTSASSKRG